jgi:tetratricopeptide (TPR) repeat protein
MALRKLFPVLLLSAFALQAQDAPDVPDPVSLEILMKNWDKAARELDQAEKQGRCKEAVCLALHARIAEGTGDGAQALAYARRAAALFGPNSGLKAGDYNDVGAILYRRGPRDPETLKLTETAFRQADAVYNAVVKAGASNIRYNLATMLKAQGRTKEAKQIMDALEAEGMLVDPGMVILGDFQRPGLE